MTHAAHIAMVIPLAVVETASGVVAQSRTVGELRDVLRLRGHDNEKRESLRKKDDIIVPVKLRHRTSQRFSEDRVHSQLNLAVWGPSQRKIMRQQESFHHAKLTLM